MRRMRPLEPGLYPLLIGIVAAALGIISIWFPLVVIPGTALIIWSSIWAYQQSRPISFTVRPEQWTSVSGGHRFVVSPRVARGRGAVTSYMTDEAGNLEEVLLDVKVTPDGGIILETGTKAEEIHFRLQ